MNDRPCNPDTQEHRDGLALVELIFGAGGVITLTQDELAARLGLWSELGRGMRSTDIRRFHRARNHVRDRTDSGLPCCGFVLHYRKDGPRSVLALVDPSGDLGDHADAAIGSLLGWATRERQHHAENARQVETFQALAAHAHARGDQYGQRICITASVELERYGTVSPATMAELVTWAQSLA